MWVGLGDSDEGFSLGRAAQGFARGLVQGVGDGIDSIGGAEAIINGKAELPADMADAMNISLDFDDSVNGAAAGLGLGLGNQGVFVATNLVNGVQRRLARREFGEGKKVLVPRQNESKETGTADISSVNDTFNVNVSNILTADALNAVAQGAVDALTCRGVGGIINMGQGLVSSGTLDAKSLTGGQENSPMKLLRQIVPKGTITVTSSGNSYAVSLKEGLEAGDLAAGFLINGNTMSQLLAFLAVHG